MVQGIALMILGIIAASSLLLPKKSYEKELSDLIVPFQGFVGFVFCLWALYSIISYCLSGFADFHINRIYGITILVVNVTQLFIGYLLGYNMISKFIFEKDKETQNKLNHFLSLKAPLNEMVGIAGIIVGLGSIIIFTL